MVDALSCCMILSKFASSRQRKNQLYRTPSISMRCCRVSVIFIGLSFFMNFSPAPLDNLPPAFSDKKRQVA
jgi:hypothetical protein